VLENIRSVVWTVFAAVYDAGHHIAVGLFWVFLASLAAGLFALCIPAR